MSRAWDGPVKRESLRFLDSAKHAFAFLVDTYGYDMQQESPLLLRFEGNGMFVNIYHGRSSFAVGVELGRLGYSDDRYSLHTLYEVLTALAPEVARQAVMQASSKEALKNSLRRAGNLLESHCRLLLEGDKAEFARVAKVVEQLRSELTERSQFGPVKERANEAWMRKDFPEAQRLYGSIQDHLSEAERRRLSYMVKKAAKQ